MILGLGALVLTLGALPCADPEASARELRSASESGQLEAELTRLSADLGVELLPGDDPELAAEAKAERAAARLAEVCALKALPAPERSPSVDAARLQRILSRPELAGARDRRADALVRLGRMFRDWLASLFETRGAQSFSRATRFLVLVAALALVGAGVAALWNRRTARRTRKVAAGGRAADPLILDEPSTHLARARAALELEPRRAIREGLLGLLSLLERGRLARPDRVKTNREIAAELPSRGAPAALSEAVAEALAWYDRTFYSLEEVPPAEAGRFLAEVDRLQARLREGAA